MSNLISDDLCDSRRSSRSNLSLVGSESVHGHPYNTRLSARLSADKSNTSLATPKRRQIVDLSATSTQKRSSRNRKRDDEKIGFFKRFFKQVIIFIAASGCIILLYFNFARILSAYDESNHINVEMRGIKKYIADITKELILVEKLLNELETAQNVDIVDSESPHRDDVRRMVSTVLEAYDADKTGKADFALESAGGSVLSTRNTTNFYDGIGGFWTTQRCEGRSGPKELINPGVLPGQCWAFKGSQGSIVVQLLGTVRISSVSLEHAPRTLSPTNSNDMAAKDFSLWGLTETNEQKLLGHFVYDVQGPGLQFFDVRSVEEAFDVVEFKIHSNHGNADFTCVYRLRVHGVLQGKLIEEKW